MSVRYCERCGSDVEDVGGFCLLGHALRVDPPIPSVAAIREEVDRAFDEARAEVASSGDSGDSHEPPPPPESARSVWAALRDDGGAADPMAAFAPAPRMDWGPERARLLSPRRRGRERPAPA